MTLNPSTVLITGANRGLGFEFVKQFLRFPSPPKLLFASCRNPEAAKDLQELVPNNPNLKIVKLDVNDEATIKDAYKVVEGELGGRGLNLIINNAGVLERGGLDDTTADSMMRVYRTNTVGPFLVARTFLPVVKRAAEQSPSKQMNCSRAAIVHISSAVGSVEENGSGSLYAYRCSKAALNMVTKSMSVDLQDTGVLVVALHPGWVHTDMAPSGPVAPPDSAQNMINRISTLDAKSAGLFFHATGRVIPW